MPFTYTNRKDVTYTLFLTRSQSGKLHYTFALQSNGEPVAELPPGFHISESPNGLVSLVRDRPSLIDPADVAAVEDAIAAHPHGDSYRVVVKPNRIEIYAKEGWDRATVQREWEAAGFKVPVLDERQREILDAYAHFVPVLRLILHDRQQRSFRAEGLVSMGLDDRWLILGQTGPLAEVAREIVPALGAESSYGFYAATVTPPWSDEPQAGPAIVGAAGPQRKPASVHQLKVTLLGLKPPIWRRIVVPSDITLSELHAIVQETMGWHDSHLHEFRIGNVGYGDPRLLEELTDQDSRKTRLGEVAPAPKKRIHYLYDFGDNWEHEILVEAVGPPTPDIDYPICLKGKLACPPEDCGGVWGYADLLEALSDPENTEREDLLDWLGGPFDPEAFDAEEVNQRLALFRRRSR